MKISEQGLALIRRFEGLSLTPYRCPAGRLTIGYGHVVGKLEKFPDSGISAGQAENLLADDAAKAVRALACYITPELSQPRVDALASFIFNVGAGAFARSTLRGVVNRGWHQEVPAQLMRWVNAGGAPLPGLVARRQAEAALYGQG